MPCSTSSPVTTTSKNGVSPCRARNGRADALTELVATAAGENADAVLVSQVVTQRDAHLSGARALAEAFAQPFGTKRPLLVVGGPRFDPSATGELGVDRIFGRGTTPREVASYLVHALAAPAAAGSAEEAAPR